MNKLLLIFGALFSLTFFLIALITLPHYNINWDEPGHYMRGQAYLRYFLFGKKDYWDLSNIDSYYQANNTIFFNPLDKEKETLSRRSIYQNDNYLFNYWFDHKTHPPVSGIFASFSNFIFFQKLGFINDIDSYHLYVVFLASVLIGIIFTWVSREYSIFAGIVSVLSLSLYPLFLGESHFNVKDIPEAVFYSITLLFFYEAIKLNKSKWMIFSAIFFGIAWATKFNIIFAPFIMVIWLLIYTKAKRPEIKKYIHLIPAMILYLPIAFSILILSWPVLWTFPFANFMESVKFYKDIGLVTDFNVNYLSILGLNTYALQWIIYTTPLATLFLMILSIIYIFKNGLSEKYSPSIFIMLWFIVPIARVTMPNANIYGGVRQIMEYIPAMSILAGIGAFYFANWVSKFLINKNHLLLLKICIVLLFIPISLKLISLHPNEGVYFNPLIGGLRGAKEKNIPYWGESLGNPYKQGLIWINQNAKKNSKLVLTFGLKSNLPSIYIRPDIEFHNKYRGVDTRFGEYVIGLTNKNKYYNDTYYSKYLERFLKPEHVVQIDGVPILKIWKNDMEHTFPEFRNSTVFNKKAGTNFDGNTLVVDFKKILTLRKIVFKIEDRSCKRNENDIRVNSSLDGNLWIDNGLGQQDVLAAGIFTNSEYIHYFPAEKVHFVKFDFLNSSSCLNGASLEEVYIFDK